MEPPLNILVSIYYWFIIGNIKYLSSHATTRIHVYASHSIYLTGNSCPNIKDETCANPNVRNEYRTFAEYMDLLQNGWPSTKVPGMIDDNEKAFSAFCKTFVIVKETAECDYVPSTRACTRVRNIVAESNQSFRGYLDASISIWVIKNSLEIIIVLYCVAINRVPTKMKTLIVDSPFFFLLLARGIYYDVVVHRLDKNDIARKFVFTFLVETLQQFALLIYFLLYVNQSVRGIFFEMMGTPGGEGISIISYVTRMCESIFLIVPLICNRVSIIS
jgi:hypothetical protein